MQKLYTLAVNIGQPADWINIPYQHHLKMTPSYTYPLYTNAVSQTADDKCSWTDYNVMS